mgnify:CR=1 FL=1
MDPEVLLMEILDLLSDMSKPVHYRPIIHNDWSVEEIMMHVENYEKWLRKGGYKPDVQNVVEKWLAHKESKAKYIPDKKQKQFWYGAEL